MSAFDPKRTAVLSMDLQHGIVSRYLKDDDPMLTRARGVLDHARGAGCLVVHVHVGFRPGFPEISERNALFGAIKRSPDYQKMFDGGGAAIHSLVAPQGRDVVVQKHRVSAFAGTDLDQILRANDIRTLVMFGIATSGVVLSTLLEASDRDYEVVVIGDCCIDSEADLHRALLDKLFARRGNVIQAAEFGR
ncbi:MAG TPA: isochorismatase family cysteine hydrolase [Vicinamibacterales bacterium]|jgi:nicotinamidase-related amidase